jgi:di/tricarboxylate transporter
MFVTIAMTQVLNGTSVATIIVPIGIILAQRIGINPRMVAMGIALASSMAFITPLGHPVNILMMSPGGYRFRDFFIVGLPLPISLYLFIIFFLPLVMP